MQIAADASGYPVVSAAVGSAVSFRSCLHFPSRHSQVSRLAALSAYAVRWASLDGQGISVRHPSSIGHRKALPFALQKPVMGGKTLGIHCFQLLEGPG